MLRDDATGLTGGQNWRDRHPPGQRRNRASRAYLRRFIDDTRNSGIPSEFEHRIWTACKTDRALSDPDSRFQGNRPLQHAIWREAVKEWTEYGAEEVKARFNPTRAQISDWEIVMSWFATLDKKDFRIIWLRSCGFFFTEIADRMLRTWGTGLSHDTAKRRYEYAMLKLLALDACSQ